MKKLMVISILITAMAGIAQAATYTWNNGAANGIWTDSGNWTEDSATYGQPSEQYTNGDLNDDAVTVEILSGDTVTGGANIFINNDCVLTLDNVSTLNAANIYAGIWRVVRVR